MIAFIAISALAVLAWTIYRGLWRRTRLRSVDAQRSKDPRSSYPYSHFLLGLDYLLENALDIARRRFAEGVQERFARYGTTCVSHVFWQKVVHTIDRENLEAVMSTDFESWKIIPARSELVTDVFGPGIFANDGACWRHSRSMVRRGMIKLKHRPDVFERHIEMLLQAIQASNGGTVDFATHAFHYSFSVAGNLLMGQHNTECGFARDFGRLVEMARALTLFHRKIPRLGSLLFGKEYVRVRNRLHERVAEQIRTAVLQSRVDGGFEDSSRSLLSELISQTDDELRVRNEVLNMLLAGRDTVGIALSETFVQPSLLLMINVLSHLHLGSTSWLAIQQPGKGFVTRFSE